MSSHRSLSRNTADEWEGRSPELNHFEPVTLLGAVGPVQHPGEPVADTRRPEPWFTLDRPALGGALAALTK
jgi:hypothetical protein